MPDELLDVVNDNDMIIGQELRSRAHKVGLQHRGVHIFLITQDNQLLVQQRGRDLETFPLAFDCSVSEHVKAGEDYLQAAERGLQEELGISNVPLQALVKFKMVYGPDDFEICVLYEGIVNPNTFQINTEDVEKITPYHLNEIIDHIREGKVTFCGWFLQIIYWYLGKPSEMTILEVYSSNHLLRIEKRS